MNEIASRRGTLVVGLLCALCACTQGTSPSGSDGRRSAAAPAASKGGTWTDNGATACDIYLTPAVVADILKSAGGHSKRLSAQACAYETPDFSTITITLMAAGTAGLDQHLKYLSDPVPLAGVGDKAVRTVMGVEAAKGSDRMCSIDVMPPFAATTGGEVLAQKLGAICNQLFAVQ